MRYGKIFVIRRPRSCFKQYFPLKDKAGTFPGMKDATADEDGFPRDISDLGSVNHVILYFELRLPVQGLCMSAYGRPTF
jgi:hypothetical protein